MHQPPYVDEHTLSVAAPPDRVWAALEHYATHRIGVSPGPAGRLAAGLLGTEPTSGFEVSAVVPGERIDLTGRHRFSHYALVFDVRQAPGGCLLRATTYADFPGWHGRLYRALVIGTRLHVVATRAMLHVVARGQSRSTR